MEFINKSNLKQRINTAFWSEVENIIESAPTIDIVPCSECIYPKQRDGFYKCNYSVVWRNATDSCSYGERKDGER